MSVAVCPDSRCRGSAINWLCHWLRFGAVDEIALDNCMAEAEVAVAVCRGCWCRGSADIVWDILSPCW